MARYLVGGRLTVNDFMDSRWLRRHREWFDPALNTAGPLHAAPAVFERLDRVAKMDPAERKRSPDNRLSIYLPSYCRAKAEVIMED